MQDTLNTLMGKFNSSEDLLTQVLTPFNLKIADDIASEFQAAVLALAGQNMGDEELTKFHVRAASEVYRLGNISTVQGLRTSIVKLHESTRSSEEFIKAVSEDGKKLTKDDKLNLAELVTEDEKFVKAIYNQAIQSIEQRLWGLKEIIKVMESIHRNNLAEKRMVGSNVQ